MKPVTRDADPAGAARLTGGQAVVRALEAHGVEVVMGIPGTHVLPVFDALLDSSIRTIPVRHEQTAAFMADGWARVSRKPGVLVTISGPGALNATAGVATAHFDSSPILTVSANIPRATLDKARGMLHDTKDLLGVFRSLVNFAERATTVADVPDAIARAFRAMRNGRSLPAYVEVPTDVLYGADEVLAPVAGAGEGARTAPDPGLVGRAVELLARARRPVLWAGGGVNRSGANAALVALAERIGTPVVTTTQGRGAIAADHPLAVVGHVSSAPVSAWLADADLLLAVGTRFSEEATSAWKLRLPETLVHVDVDAAEIGRSCAADLGIVADARLALEALAGAAPSHAARAREVAAVNQRTRAFFARRNPEAIAVLDDLRAAIPRDGIVVGDSTRLAYWATMAMPVFVPNGYLYPGYGTLGGGLPMALGAKLAAPDRAVVALVGDGGFQYSFPDLATAAQEDLRVVVVLVNDGLYGVLAEQQDGLYGRRAAVALANPDFGAIVRAYGLDHVALATWEGLGDAVRAALEADRTTVVEVRQALASPPWGLEGGQV
jgi:acetolactate synthase-1/2/3 large subunit